MTLKINLAICLTCCWRRRGWPSVCLKLSPRAPRWVMSWQGAERVLGKRKAHLSEENWNRNPVTLTCCVNSLCRKKKAQQWMPSGYLCLAVQGKTCPTAAANSSQTSAPNRGSLLLWWNFAARTRKPEAPLGRSPFTGDPKHLLTGGWHSCLLRNSR